MSIFVANAGRERRTLQKGLRRIAVILAALVIAFTAASVSAPAASAGARLGGIDMNRACRVQWDFEDEYARLDKPFTENDWHCYAGSFYDGGIAVNWACNEQYGPVNVHGWVDRPGDPYSWSCYYND